MNKDIASGKWSEFKGEIKKLWGDLTDNELDRTNGNVDAIGGLLQQKYGSLKEDVKAGFDKLVSRYGHVASESTQAAKEQLREANQKEEIH